MPHIAKFLRVLGATSLGALALTLSAMPSQAHGGIDYYLVSNTKDSGPGSLRDAIIHANDDDETQIAFQIATTDPNYDKKTGVFTIAPQQPLPRVTGKGTVFDGLAQTLVNNSNPKGPEICLSGKYLPNGASGIVVESPNGEIKGIAFKDFKTNGVVLTGEKALENRVQSNTFQNIKGAAVVMAAGASANWIGIAPPTKPPTEDGDDDFAGIYSDDMGNDFQNCAEGVRVSGNESVGNSIRGNRFETVALPIEFWMPGKKAAVQNVAMSSDDNGPNNNQTAPKIESVKRIEGADLEGKEGVWHEITGVYRGAPTSTLTIDVYWDAKTPTEDGKGQTSMTSLQIKTDENGIAHWKTQVRGYPAGKMRATATSITGSTSQLSEPFDVPWLF